MKNLKRNKGITLVALIITIIVLLILAVVAIRAVTGDGILAHAKNAKSEYELAQEKEEGMLEYYTGILETGEVVPTVEQLEEQYEFAYYSAFSKAITDANNSTIENADANKENAVAGIYTNETGETVVVLMKDTTESDRVTVAKDMTINLGGNVLSVKNDKATKTLVAISGTEEHTDLIKIDGRIKGSGINVENISDVNAGIFRTMTNTFIVNGGEYTTKSDIDEITEENREVRIANCYEGTLKMSDCNMESTISAQKSTVDSTVTYAIGITGARKY